jgi:hypothetical protein
MVEISESANAIKEALAITPTKPDNPTKTNFTIETPEEKLKSKDELFTDNKRRLELKEKADKRTPEETKEYLELEKEEAQRKVEEAQRKVEEEEKANPVEALKKTEEEINELRGKEGKPTDEDHAKLIKLYDKAEYLKILIDPAGRQAFVEAKIKELIEKNNSGEELSDKEKIELGTLQKEQKELDIKLHPEKEIERIDKREKEIKKKLKDGAVTPDEQKELASLDLQKESLLKQQAVTEEANKQKQIEENERQKTLERRAKIVQYASFAAGIAVGATVASQLPILAVVGVTLGGNLGGLALRKLAEKSQQKYQGLLQKSRYNLSITETTELEAQINRAKKWASILKYASIGVMNFSTGFGFGYSLRQAYNFFKARQAGANVTTPETIKSTAKGNSSDSFSKLHNPQSTGNGQSVIPKNAGLGTADQVVAEVAESTSNGWLGNTKWIKASDFGWDFSKLGWTGNSVALGAEGGSTYPPINKAFFETLSRLVPKENLVGQAAGDTVNTFLRQAYTGVDAVQAAQGAASALGF